MKPGINALSLALGMAAAAALSVGIAQAGEFKTLNTASLAVGGKVSAHSSPKNTGAAMEMEVYEWPSASTGGSYTCDIASNGSGQSLHISLVGVNATIINSCTALAGGSCSTPIVSLVGNLKFQCLVASQNGAPVSSTAHYSMSVTRH